MCVHTYIPYVCIYIYIYIHVKTLTCKGSVPSYTCSVALLSRSCCSGKGHFLHPGFNIALF